MAYRIVVGVDGSEPGEAALAWAVAEARARGGEVTAVHAWQMPLVSVPGAFDRADMERAAQDRLLDIVGRVAAGPAVPLHTLVAEGDPAACLIEASAGADLLVVGARGRSPWMEWLRDSVSQRCAAAGECPVVLVKPPGAAPGPVRG